MTLMHGQDMRLYIDGQEMRATSWQIDYHMPTISVYSLGQAAPQVATAGPPEMSIQLAGVRPIGPPPGFTVPSPLPDIVTHAAGTCCCRNCPGDCR